MTKETEAAGPLTLDGILDAATAIIEAHGVAGLTMRRLAAACDSTPMTLYRHVRDKSELERAVADRFLGGVPLPRPLADWREGVGDWLGDLRRVLLGSPGLAALALASWPRLRGRVLLLDRLYGILHEAGYRGPDVVIAADAIELYAVGSIGRDLAALPPTSSERATGRAGPGDGMLLHIGVGSTPNLVEFAAYLVKRDAGVMFASGLDALIRGLEATLDPVPD